MITFKDLSFRYPNHTRLIFEDFSISFPPNKTTVILGPNGCGKSTLFHLAYGWLHPEKGQVFISGKSIGLFSRQEIGKSLAILPQQEKAPFHLSLFDYILMGRTPYTTFLAEPSTEDYQLTNEIINQLGINQLTDKLLTQLSGGEQQFAFIARALNQKTPVLLLDEVTTHLDLNHIKTIFSIINTLKTEGKTIIITLHDPNLAYAIADEIVIMFPDRSYKQDVPSKVMTADNLSRAFLTKIPLNGDASHFSINWENFLK